MKAAKTVVAEKRREAVRHCRQTGYNIGVTDERVLVLRAIDVEAKEWESLGMKDEAHALRILEKVIKQGLHAIPAGKSR